MILASIFRDSAAYVDRYVDQIKALREYQPVTVIAVEGDSSDDTYDRLRATDFHVLKAEHGGPKFGSVAHPLRWRQIAVAGSACLAAAMRLVRDDPQPFCYVESDLIWGPGVVQQLLGDLARVPAVAPLSMQRGRFYDIWGYTLNDRMFRPYPPYHDDIDMLGLSRIDTCGSMFVTRAECVDVLEFSAVDCPRGIGRSLYANGYSLWLDPTVRVEHP
jgi:hypothetical protein